MQLEKYHGLGNDFLITDDLMIIDNKKLIIQLCNRYTGIGADGLIVVKKNPLEMVFYNQDGTRGEMCGNGIRCFSHYCYHHHLINTNSFLVNTLDGTKIIKIESISPFVVTVMMGKFIDNYKVFNIEFNDAIYQVYYITFGVPHTIIYTNDQTNKELGRYISNHPLFKNRTNVNFVKIIDEQTINIKTYERGVGFTKACGTGSCASFIISKHLGFVKSFVNVRQEEGSLKIYLEEEQIYMQGPSVKIANIIFNEE